MCSSVAKDLSSFLNRLEAEQEIDNQEQREEIAEPISDVTGDELGYHWEEERASESGAPPEQKEKWRKTGCY